MSCAIAKYDICTRSNRDLNLRFVVKKDGVAVDLTGATIEMQVRSFSSAAQVLLDATPFITKGAQVGEFMLDIPEAAASEFTFSQGRYDIRIIFGSGEIIVPFGGSFTVEKGVTYG